MRIRNRIVVCVSPFLVMAVACGEGGSEAAPGGSAMAGSAGTTADEGGITGGAAGDPSGGSGGSAGGSGAGATGGLGGSAGAAGGDGSCSYQLGWAKEVKGGLGGTIIPVTTLDRDGPGSFQEALDVKGPRVIVFEVGGVIDLETRSYRVREPFVTIAGQTAPSPGITMIRGTLSISTHDVVVQHIRVRPGEADQDVGWEPDGISLSSAHDVIIDHCSITWAIDENLSASGPRFGGDTPEQWRENTSHRVTFSNNIVAEALSSSTHEKGEHSKGSLIHDNVTEILVYGSLYASNVDRNPLFKGGARGAVVNNFITNPRRYGVTYGLVASEWGTNPHQTGMISMVGNVMHNGLNTVSNGAFFRAAGGPVEIFMEDNIAQDLDGNPIEWFAGDLTQIHELGGPPIWPEAFTANPSASVLQKILDDVGARPWDRDPIDNRIVEQALAGTSVHIDHEDEGGGYPQHTPIYAPFIASEWDECFEPKP